MFLRCERLHITVLITFQYMFVFCFSLQTSSRARLFLNHLFFCPLSYHLILLFFDFHSLVPFTSYHYFAIKITLLRQCLNRLSHSALSFQHNS